MPNSFINNELTELPAVISAPRFATYLRAKGGNVPDALALYRWNLQISSAFFVPLQICEVAIRNSVTDALNSVYTPNWPWSNTFRISLPTAGNYKPKDEIIKVAARHPTVGKVVAEMTFMFWQKMFTARHENRIWQDELLNVLPGIPKIRTVSSLVLEIHDDLETIRKLRNRIAHHEPIFSRDLDLDYKMIRSLINYRNPTAANWVDRIQNVQALIENKP